MGRKVVTPKLSILSARPPIESGGCFTSVVMHMNRYVFLDMAADRQGTADSTVDAS